MRFTKGSLILMGVLVGVVAFTAPASARIVPQPQAPYTYVVPTTSDTSATTTAATTTSSVSGTTTQSTTTTTVTTTVTAPPAIVAQPLAALNNLATQLDSMLKQLIALLTTQLQDLQQQVAAKLGQGSAATTPSTATTPAATATTTAQTAATSTAATSTAAANQLPKVNITFPYSGLEFTAPASFDVIASAVDDDGAVSKVEFFEDGGSLGIYTGSQGPWSVRRNGISAGAHTLTAQVTDDKGGQTTSAPVTLTVKALSQGTTGFTDEPPVITIATTMTGANLTATATVTTYAGSITQVVWSRAASTTSHASFATDTTSPFTAASTLAVGAHTISAIATNSQGSQTRSASTTVTTN